ncbi:MAG: hypothetical protein ABI614_09990 [Planctomycetota bacterium]
MAQKTMNPEPSNSEPGSLAETNRWLDDLLNRADGGDSAALSEIRGLFKKVPSLISAVGGDLAELATNALIDAITGEGVVVKEAMLQHLELMQAELAGSNPSPIERLLVDRVVSCALHANHADFKAASSGTVSLQLGDYHQRRQDRAHRRLLSAIKTLATVRRLAVPIRVDLNVTASVETKPAEPAHSMPLGWERASLAN